MGNSADRREMESMKRMGNKMLAEVLYSGYPPHELVLQWADSHCNLHAALYRHLQRGAVLLKQEVPPLWCSSANHKHGHGDVDREAENKKAFGSVTFHLYIASILRQL